MILHVQRQIDGDGEGHAHVAAGAAVDLRIDADHLAVHVEQGTSGVTRIHSRIRLNKGHVGFIQRTRGGTHDPGSHAVLEAERRTDGDYPLTGPQALRVTEANGGQAGRGNFDQRHIAALVDANHLGDEFPAIGELDCHLGGIGHHVRIGQHVTIGADDES